MKAISDDPLQVQVRRLWNLLSGVQNIRYSADGEYSQMYDC